MGNLLKSEGLPDAFAFHVLSAVSSKNMFPELDEHMLDTTVDDNHMCKLILKSSHTYSKVSFFQLGKELTGLVSKKRVRKKFNKLVIFNHQ